MKIISSERCTYRCKRIVRMRGGINAIPMQRILHMFISWYVLHEHKNQVLMVVGRTTSVQA